jgi:hypothetical protein
MQFCTQDLSFPCDAFISGAAQAKTTSKRVSNGLPRIADFPDGAANGGCLLFLCTVNLVGGFHMSDPNLKESNTAASESISKSKSTKSRLRGTALEGADQKSTVDHTDYEKSRNPDGELHLDDEDDSLYVDGLDVGDDSEPLAGTDGNAPPGGVKG